MTDQARINELNALAAEAATLRTTVAEQQKQIVALQSELYAGDNGTLSYRQIRDRLLTAEIAATQQQKRIEALEREVAATRKDRNKYMDSANASAHVIVEAGVIPGCDYPCRCDECRSVATSMAKAGYLDRVKDQWWKTAAIAAEGAL